MIVYLIEIQGYNPDTTSVETLYFASHPIRAFSSTDADRANVYYDSRLVEFTGFQKSMFSASTVTGKSTTNGGAIVLANTDDTLSYLRNWGFDGRLMTIYTGDGVSAFNTYSKILTGTLEAPVFSLSVGESNLAFKIRDRQQILDVDIQTTKYLGTNVGATGDEGLEDLEGEIKPLLFGECYNVTPTVCNSAALRYQVHDGAIQSVDAVYDKGVLLTVGSNYTVNLTTGIITLITSPAGEITCDIKGSTAGGYSDDAATIIKNIVKDYGGLVDADLDLTSFSTLATAMPDKVGVYIKSNMKILEVCDILINSVNAYHVFNSLGIMSVGQMTDPVTDGSSVVADFTEATITELSLTEPTDTENGVPTDKVTISYKKCYSVQDKDSLAAATTIAEFVKKEYRKVESSDAAVKTKHLLAKDLEFESALVAKADAEALALDYLTMFKVKRSIYKIVVPFEYAKDLEFNDTVTLTLPVLNLGSSVRFKVISLAHHLPDDSFTTIGVWG